MTTLERVLDALSRPPRACPACRVPLRRAFPACPACGEALTPAALKRRADAAAQAGLGLPEAREWVFPSQMPEDR